MTLATLADIPLAPRNTQLSPTQTPTDPLYTTSNCRATFTLLARRQRPFATGKAIRAQLIALHQAFLYPYIQRLLYRPLKPNGLEVILSTSTAADEPDLPSEGATSSLGAVPAVPNLPAAPAAGPTAAPSPLDETSSCGAGRRARRAPAFSPMPSDPACASSAQGGKAHGSRRICPRRARPRPRARC